jgi:hypothetical protein
MCYLSWKRKMEKESNNPSKLHNTTCLQKQLRIIKKINKLLENPKFKVDSSNRKSMPFKTT